MKTFLLAGFIGLMCGACVVTLDTLAYSGLFKYDWMPSLHILIVFVIIAFGFLLGRLPKSIYILNICFALTLAVLINQLWDYFEHRELFNVGSTPLIVYGYTIYGAIGFGAAIALRLLSRRSQLTKP